LTRKWLRERQNDYYHKLAVEEGYRSRAAYKLLQIDQKYQIFKTNDVVLDLGASPGGWMQAARVIVGEKGYVLGVDLKEIESFKQPNVVSIIADVNQLEFTDIIKRLPRRPNVIISDMSPNVSGIWSLDHVRQLDLASIALKLSEQLLNPGGNFVVKVFQGEFFKSFLEDVRRQFQIVRVVKPKASRSESAEIYLVCINFNG